MAGDGFKEDDGFVPDEPEGGAEGGTGSDRGPSKQLEKPIKMGSITDALKSAANSAVLGAGPQIEGVMGALAAGVQPENLSSPAANEKAMLDAYRAIRDMGKAEHAKSADTALGKVGTGAGMLLTPVPFNSAPGASIPMRGLVGAGNGAVIGGLNAAFNSPTDLTTADADALKQFLKDTGAGMAGGAVVGGLAGAGLGAAEKPLKNTAEEQALRAAGLRGGINNQLRKELGVPGMEEARKLGRSFLDTKLIPPVGSSEAVAKRAEALQDLSGRTIDRVLGEADTTSLQPFDYKQFGDAARQPLDHATAVADEMSGTKARALADSLEHQGQRTPGSFRGANEAKSDAWKSARFSEDAPMSMQLYRKANAAARNNIEKQVSDAIGPEQAQLLNDANFLYGTGADASKLANEAATRNLAKKGFGMPEILALTTGAGAGAGAAAGHPISGGLAGLATALGAKAFDKYGHSTAARFADFLAKRAAEDTGGNLGGRAGSKLGQYLEHISDDKEKPWSKLTGDNNE